jgi:hypothetical protein
MLSSPSTHAKIRPNFTTFNSTICSPAKINSSGGYLQVLSPSKVAAVHSKSCLEVGSSTHELKARATNFQRLK